jgi:alpha-glucosidase
VFVRAGAIVPEQPLVESTDETPQGPLTLRVYPPLKPDQDCSGSLYLDDGVSYAYEKGEYVRMGFTCRLTAQGLTVTVAPRKGSFAPWWKELSIEVYGAARPVVGASYTIQGQGGGPATATPIEAGFDAEMHRVTAMIPEDGKGVELRLAY